MSKSQSLQAALLSLSLICLGVAPAAAAGPPATPQNFSVMVVDIQTLLQKSKAAQTVRRQIETKRAQYAREIAAAEQKLNKEKDQLQRAQGSLSPAALNKKEIKFQQELNEFKIGYRSKVEALQKSSNEAFTAIQHVPCSGAVANHRQVSKGAKG
jgi:Skp family chaperone for outer membrane proteins